MPRPITTEIAIVGGGVAGLWVLNLLRARGIDCRLFEASALGAGQTIASQGLIHGGVKYTLSGATTSASETIAAMPDRWRACLSGEGDIDLSETRVLSDSHYLFADGRATSRLTAFFASRALRGRVRKVTGDGLPEVFRHPAFDGVVYRLNDFVVDTASLLASLAAPHRDRIHYGALSVGESGQLRDGNGADVQAQKTILAAGEGNQRILQAMEIPVAMQRRPLSQVLVTGNLPRVYAHAVSLGSADKPLVTITSHRAANGQTTWYLGGAIAEETARPDEDQKQAALQLLGHLFPWLDLRETRVGVRRIDRAEPARSEGGRPDAPFVAKHVVNSHGDVIVCWPVKLTLAPLLGDMALKEIGVANAGAGEMMTGGDQRDGAAAKIAPAPWEEHHA